MYNLGEALVISDSNKVFDWWSKDIYYVIYHVGSVCDIVDRVTYNDILLVRTLGGLELLAHGSRFELASRVLVRDDKLGYLIR